MSDQPLTLPNETPEYRAAREELLRAEVELREQTERVAELRRALPPGGTIPTDYAFERLDDHGIVEEVRMSDLFGDKDTLFVYTLMYGPQMAKPCPLCVAMLDGLEGQIEHIRAHLAVAVVARSPIHRVAAFGRGRGWSRMPLLSDEHNDFHHDYHAETDRGGQLPMAYVFTREGEGEDVTIRNTWASEMLFAERPEPIDARHVDAIWPLWNVLDLTPAGRGSAYPKLTYSS